MLPTSDVWHYKEPVHEQLWWNNWQHVFLIIDILLFVSALFLPLYIIYLINTLQIFNYKYTTAAYVRDAYGAFRQPKFECGCCEMLVFSVCCARQNFYVFSLYCNLDLDDRIYDCLLTVMAAVQAADARASYLFLGDLNGHHQEWLGSNTTNRHGVADLDIASVSGCDQLVIGPIHGGHARNSWPPDDWCSWPSTGGCCSTTR